jgi:hypothetical protein
MPAKTRISLLTTETHGVHPLRRERGGEILQPALDVPLRGDQAITQQSGVPVQEGDGVVIFVHDVVVVLGMTSDKDADEARPSMDAAKSKSAILFDGSRPQE